MCAEKKWERSEAPLAVDITPQGTCRGLAEILDRIADKWAIMVVGNLSEEPVRRFNELMRAIPGISHRMLTLTLRNLEREGVVVRTPFATMPPRVDYSLTGLGRSLTKPLSILASWAEDKRPEIEKARHSYDERLHLSKPGAERC